MLILALFTASYAQTVTAADLPAITANPYAIPMDAERTLWTDDAGRAPSGTWFAKVGLDYIHTPWAVEFEDGSREQVLSHVFAVDLVGGATFGPIRAGVDVSLLPMVRSDFDKVGGAGLGDLAFDVKGTLRDPVEHNIGIALAGRLALPTASFQGPGTTERPSWNVRLILDKRVGDLLLAANLGTIGGPAAQSQNLDVNDAFMFRVGAGYAVTETSGLSLDLGGQVSYRNPFADVTGNPMEAMVGGYVRPNSNLVVRGGIGTGLNSAVGAPSLRALLVIGYERTTAQDTDADGVMDARDECPFDPEDRDNFEDHDGCPDPDNDADTISDSADACPDEPEDPDGWADEDGCPDPHTSVVFEVTDPAGHLVPGVTSRLVPDAREYNASFTVELEPGSYKMSAEAEGYRPITAAFVVPEGAQIEVVHVMEPLVVTGVASVRVTDSDGRPIRGMVTLGSDFFPVDGALELSLQQGAHDVTATAPGYLAQSATFHIATGASTDIVLELPTAPRTLEVVVTDVAGVPVDATWRIDAGPTEALTGGSATRQLMPGTYRIVFDAPGYQSQTVDVDIEGEVTRLAVELLKGIILSEQRIDLGDTVYFDTSAATIKPESHALLDEVATILLAHPNILRVRIEGHTDSRGSASFNLDLSERRAASVRRYLVEQGVDAGRLVSQGFGESQPLDASENEAAWTKNRRVDFFIEERAD